MNSDLVASVPAFKDLDTQTLGEIAARLEEQQLPAGAILMRQGEPGEALFFVLKGELEVSVASGSATGGDGDREAKPVVVDRLGPGAVIGEMALLAGNRRTATVVARSGADVARLTRAEFDRLAGAHLGLRERVLSAIAPRLERVQLAAVLERWFGVRGDDAGAIHELQQATELLQLPAGTPLYRAGARAEGMFIVVNGRLQVTNPGGDGSGDYQVGRGESLGELGVLGGDVREEDATAIRESHLLHVPGSVVEANPRIMRRIATTAVERVGAASRRRRHGNGLRTVALVPAHPGAPVLEVAAMLERELGNDGTLLRIDERLVAEAFGGSIPTAESTLGVSLTHWLNELEAEHDYLVLIAESTSGQWVDRCRSQADALLAVADAGRRPDDHTAPVPEGAELVLLQPAGTERPSGTAAWLERSGVQRFHHLRAGDALGVDRLARRLKGIATGVVFSGGGARGYAHIGLLRAIEELGIEVDMVAGTSMGALMAATYAHSGSYQEAARAAVTFGDRKRLLDRTLPLVALMKSQGVTETFQSIFGDERIEDLWWPFACVSANLFEAVPVEHERGPIWEAVRASTAIPGIFTPLVKDGGLLVDGAVMNAFPVDLMRRMVGPGTVLASSTMSKSAPRAPFTFGPSVSGWEALAQYLRPRKRRRPYPTMIKTLMEATSVGSKHQSMAVKAAADLVVELPVSDYGKLEFHRHAELIELGYRHALEALGRWLAEGGTDDRPEPGGGARRSPTPASPAPLS